MPHGSAEVGRQGTNLLLCRISGGECRDLRGGEGHLDAPFRLTAAHPNCSWSDANTTAGAAAVARVVSMAISFVDHRRAVPNQSADHRVERVVPQFAHRTPPIIASCRVAPPRSGSWFQAAIAHLVMPAAETARRLAAWQCRRKETQARRPYRRFSRSPRVAMRRNVTGTGANPRGVVRNAPPCGMLSASFGAARNKQCGTRRPLWGR